MASTSHTVFRLIMDVAPSECMEYCEVVFDGDVRGQFLPELFWKQPENKHEFASNSKVSCNIAKLIEGGSPRIEVRNHGSNEPEQIVMHFIVYAWNQSAVIPPIDDMMEKFHSSSCIVVKGLVKTKQQDIAEMIRLDTQVFRNGPYPLVLHPKTHLTLCELQNFVNEFPDARTFTYFGVDSGENLIAVWTWLKLHFNDQFRLNVIWTKWDRNRASSVRDNILDFLESTQIQFVYSDSSTYESDGFYSAKRGDLLIFTYVAPWMSSLITDLTPYIKFEMKNSSHILFVNPKNPAGLARDAIERDWETEYKTRAEILELLNLKKSMDRKPPPDDCDSQFWKIKSHEGYEQSRSNDIQYKGDVIYLPCFDRQRSRYERTDLSRFYQDIVRNLEEESEVLFFDAVKFSASDFNRDTLVQRLMECSFNETLLRVLHARFREGLEEVLDSRTRRKLSIVVLNGEFLAPSEKQALNGSLTQFPGNIDLLYVRRTWKPQMMDSTEEYEDLSIWEDTDQRHWATGTVIQKLMTHSQINLGVDWKLSDLTGHEFCVVRTHSGNQVGNEVHCFSINFLTHLIKQVTDPATQKFRFITSTNRATVNHELSKWQDCITNLEQNRTLNDDG